MLSPLMYTGLLIKEKMNFERKELWKRLEYTAFFIYTAIIKKRKVSISLLAKTVSE